MPVIRHKINNIPQCSFSLSLSNVKIIIIIILQKRKISSGVEVLFFNKSFPLLIKSGIKYIDIVMYDNII